VNYTGAQGTISFRLAIPVWRNRQKPITRHFLIAFTLESGRGPLEVSALAQFWPPSVVNSCGRGYSPHHLGCPFLFFVYIVPAAIETNTGMESDQGELQFEETAEPAIFPGRLSQCLR
jgi:hypothetical protein